MKLIFHPLAKDEFKTSADWYKERSSEYEEKYVNSVFTIIERIINNPKLFQIIKGEKRAAKVDGFPFSVIYIVDFENIYVISVFHHSRSPNVWKKRTII